MPFIILCRHDQRKVKTLSDNALCLCKNFGYTKQKHCAHTNVSITIWKMRTPLLFRLRPPSTPSSPSFRSPISYDDDGGDDDDDGGDNDEYDDNDDENDEHLSVQPSQDPSSPSFRSLISERYSRPPRYRTATIPPSSTGSFFVLDEVPWTGGHAIFALPRFQLHKICQFTSEMIAHLLAAAGPWG